ncbi:MAG: NYN domain-containing protein [Clostridiales bacterium]|nr:NYN domain-containing protein [Clostridiales bacterium]
MREYLVVDGYNIINSWPDLRITKDHSLEEARERLIDVLRDYQGYRGIGVIVVFDAYNTDSMVGHSEHYGKVQVVYTKKNETADHYIERWVDENGKDKNIWVATSDFLEQTIVMSRGGIRMSARELLEEILRVKGERDRRHTKIHGLKANKLGDRINPEIQGRLEAWRRKR